ncbi:MAG: LamG domain-containing protein [bacterium]
MPNGMEANGSYPGGGAWFPLDENDPTMGVSDVAVQYTGQCTGACPASVPGAQGIGRGFKFAGEQLRIPGLPEPDDKTGYTVGVWARLDSFPPGDTVDTSYACAVAKPNLSMPRLEPSDGDSYALCVDLAHRVYVYTTSDAAATTMTAMGPRAELASTGEWHHLATTLDPACRRQILYVDGCRVNVATDIDVRFDPSAVFVGADNLGTTGAAPAYFWTGVLDEVLLFRRALSDVEIKRLAASRL